MFISLFALRHLTISHYKQEQIFIELDTEKCIKIDN